MFNGNQISAKYIKSTQKEKKRSALLAWYASVVNNNNFKHLEK